MTTSTENNERTGFLSRVGSALQHSWQKFDYFYLRGTWDLWTGRKSRPDDYWGRCRQVCADPNNRHIARVRDAGRIVDDHLVMHNGLKVNLGAHAYYDDFSRIVLATNRGVHEPQEERLFQEVLKHLPRGATMIELGAYWAFYSMWFKHEIADGRCFMIEPDPARLESGRANFRLNQMEGTFVQGKMGVDGIRVDDFLDRQGIETVHLLHSDIQGAEWEMLQSCEQAMAANRIWYLFISTHSQALHYKCLHFLQERDFVILSAADFDRGTYCGDGIIVARSPHVRGFEPIRIPLRRQNRPLLPTGAGGLEPLSEGRDQTAARGSGTAHSIALPLIRVNGLPLTAPADDQVGRQGHAHMLQRLSANHLDYPWSVTLETQAGPADAATSAGAKWAHGPRGKLTDRLFDKILGDLADRPGRYPQWFRLGRLSEPFADPRVFRFSRAIVDRFPQSRLRFRTKGALLDRKKMCRLLATPNVELVTVTLDGGLLKLRDNVAPSPSGQTIQNLRYLHKRHAAGDVLFRVKVNLSGAGTVADNESLVRMRHEFPLFEHAVLPPVTETPPVAGTAQDVSDLGCWQWYHLHLLPDGREAFCYRDPEGHRGAGHAGREHVLDIYNHPGRRRLRELLPARREAGHCAGCPAVGLSVRRRAA